MIGDRAGFLRRLIAMTIYDGDSFFTLTTAGRAGLIALSALLAALTIWAVWRAGRGRRPVTRVLIALAAFYLFTWLSPQVYYGYYLLIFQGLPVQIVIGAPPSVAGVAQLLIFQGADTLSDHGKGVLGWLLIAAGLAAKRST